MKIKNFFKRFALACAGAMALTAATTLTGCSSDMEEPTGLGVQHVEQGVIATTGGELTFTVHPGVMDNWTITFLDADGLGFKTLDWVQLSKASGTGETKVTATVTANVMGWQREAKAIVNAGDRKIPIPIVQAAAPAYFRVTPEALTNLPPSEGGQYIARTLEVESNVKWYAEIVHDDVNGNPVEPWASFLPDNTATHADAGTPATGNASLDLSILNWEQVGGNPRTATVKFYAPDGTLLKEVAISQNPLEAYFRVTPSSLTGLPWSEGGANVNRTLTVESNITWYAELTRQSDPVWVQFAGSTDNYGGPYAAAIDGDARIGLDIDNYLGYVTTPPRTATVTFYDSRDGAVLATVPVSQNPRPWLRIDKQPERLGREHNAMFEDTLVPPGSGYASSHDLTVEATLFNSNEPITYTWYYSKTRTTDDDTAEGGTPLPVDLTSDGGKTITLTYQLLREKYSYGGFFYCVVSSPGAESVTSKTIELWCAAGGLG